jgi:maltooligosyltrehalose trehalohydrolase
LRVGANYQDGTCDFVVWAPNHKQVTLLLVGQNQRFGMQRLEGGYWTCTAQNIASDTLYTYQLDKGMQKPDPASHFQPQGVFGPSAVVDHASFKWDDQRWRGLNLGDMVFYELHVGAFTPEGTFNAAVSRIGELADLGFSAVELMPISQFSGKRNWGYDGVFPFAVQNSYGTPNDLKSLVNECHRQEVALFLDCVYNHLGPEGNGLNDFAPYFPNSRMGLWGPKVNLDGFQSEGVRNFFLENALYWLSQYHVDGIRIDAVFSMADRSPVHFLGELNDAVKLYSDKVGKKCHLIAESGCNFPQVLAPSQQGGFGFDGQWLDDFQHALFALLTGEREGYYRYYGSLRDVAEALTDAYVYMGSEDDFKRRNPNESYSWIPADKFVVFSQNHDQIGNRLLGDRLTTIAGLEAAKTAACITFLSPYVPLIFMGEEFGETAPFMFFTDYQDKQLIDAVREGRKREFVEFHWQGEVPNPQSDEVFEKSKINWQTRRSEKGKQIAAYYSTLIKLKKLPVFRSVAGRQIKQVKTENDRVLMLLKENGNTQAVIVANFSRQLCSFVFPFEGEGFVKLLDSADTAWAGGGSTLPYKAAKGDVHTLHGFHAAVYLKSAVEADKPVG